jgi:methyltransferase family protein
MKLIKYFKKGRHLLKSPQYIDGQKKNSLEKRKTPSRTVIINYLLSLLSRETTYLEIGVRNPEHNFNHINATQKYSVNPGVEFEANPVDFNVTSDDFFKQLKENKLLSPEIMFDVIFIDGLHLAEQVDRDIKNAMEYIKDDGFIVLHDCNPPTEWHARTDFNYIHTPAYRSWNGTTWKAFLKWRFNPNVNSCCINSDWGVGILSKNQKIGAPITQENEFYEYSELENNRVKLLNLISFEDFKQRIN